MAPLAIIGIAARYAQEASDTEKFWEFLLRARQATTPFPKDRLDSNAFYHPDTEHGGTFSVQGGHFLAETPNAFDAGFFSITKAEVQSMDPQQRLVMENVYHALENAGISMEKAISSNTSVFAGAFNADHLLLLNSDVETSFKHLTTGTQQSMVPSRVSWFYDFRGPSVSINTACSSSLVALNSAAQSIAAGECEMAVVTGGSAHLHMADIIAFSHAGFLGPSGKCYSFDDRAEGYARGEGVGTIIVKNLDQALKDGDTIRAVIRETHTNQDGKTTSITLPSAEAQEELIRHIYKKASLDPKDTLFVEAHGTGTAAGDPLEAKALARAFASDSRKQPLYVGALKASIGHLEGGAGIAGIIKSIMILESGIIPPNVNFEKVNPAIPKEEWNIDFPTECIPWPDSGVRRASVNCFGFGGTNAHCILEDAYHFLKDNELEGIHTTRPSVPTKHQISELLATFQKHSQIGNQVNGLTNGDVNGHVNGEVNGHVNGVNGEMEEAGSAIPRLFVLSAFDKEGVKRVASDLRQYLAPSLSLPFNAAEELLNNLAYTLSERRSRFQWESHILASSISELDEKLSVASALPKPTSTGGPLRIGFVFTGQGAQYPGMAKPLMIYPVFRKSVEDAAAYMRKLGSPTSMLDELVNEQDEGKIHTPAISQPGCTVLQVALVDLLASWNVYPSSVVGHSSGEIAAAYCAGKISREAAWAASYYRGYVLSKPSSTKGAMMAVGLEQEQLQPYMDKIHATHQGELVIACYNGPRNHTISGDEAMVDALKQLLDADEVFARKLKVQDAYHSALMRPFAPEYLELMGALPAEKTPRDGCRMFSSVTGKEVEGDKLGASYWTDNMVSPVRFQGALSSLLLQSSETDGKVGIDEIIELGPHSTLQSVIKETITASDLPAIPYASLLSRHDPSVGVILKAVGGLRAKKYPVNVYEANHNRIGQEGRPRLLVNLPPYAFNHTEQGYYESRLSRNLRFRKFPRHQLFGSPVEDWDRQNRRWRHFLRSTENPWLSDHVVTGRSVFPAAGYLTMALEAVRQVTGDVVELTGLRFKDVTIKAALVVPDTKEGVEVSLSIIPVNESNHWQSSVWKWWRVASYDPSYDDWVEHCSGYISIEYVTPPDPIDQGRESGAVTDAWKQVMDQSVQVCQKPLDDGELFEGLKTIGNEYGTTFRNLSNVTVSGQQAGATTGVATTPDLAVVMPKGFIHPHLIHPTTLDSMFLAGLIAIADHEDRTVPRFPMVPTFIKEAWVSADINSQAGTSFRYQGKASPIAHNVYTFDLKGSDTPTGEPRMSLDGVRFMPLAGENSSLDDGEKLGYTINWIPDIDTLTTSEFSDKLSVEPSSSYEVEREEFERLQLASLLLVTDALSVLEIEGVSQFEGHLQKYYDWMKKVAGEFTHVSLDTWRKYSGDPELKQQLYESVERSALGELLVRLGTNIVPILQNKADPLFLMFGQDDLMSRYYEEMVTQGDSKENLDKFLSLMADSYDGLEVLEVGAGTGAFTKPFLNALAPRSEADGETTTGANKIARYTFTDISPSFFPKAEDALEPWKDVLTYQKLDIATDPATQGFSAAKYDIIIASNAVHATSDLQKSLENCRFMLKPGGKLLINEVARQDLLWISLKFGLLPGWWLSCEDVRKWSPLLAPSQWTDFLRRSGFSGVDLEIPNSRYPEMERITTMLSTAVEDAEVHRGNDVIILCPSAGVEYDLASEIKAELVGSLGMASCTLMQPQDLQGKDVTNAICLSLLELENPVLSEISEQDFKDIQRLFSTCKKLLWVTGDPAARPEFSMSTGMIRTIRWERDAESPNITTLAIADRASSLAKQVLDSILKIFRYQFTIGPGKHNNAEYLVRSGLTYTNRIHNHEKATDFLMSQFSTPTPEMIPWKDVGRPIKLNCGAPGQLDKLQWVTDTSYTPLLGDNEVEIDIQAVGLNFVDLLTVMGEVPWDVIGREAAGIITKVGAGVERFKPGDRVVYLAESAAKGTFQTHCRTGQDLVARMPDDMSFTVGAGLPVVYGTVIYSLTYVGRLAAGEKILIHSAAGGVGQAAIQYAQALGAEIFATVSSVEKMEFLKKEYGIPEDHVFSSRDASFAQGVMRMTDNSGVDVVLNSLSRDHLRRTWECVAPFGRFIEIGKKDLLAGGKLDMSPFIHNITFAGVDLLALATSKPRVIKELLSETMSLWENKKIKGAYPITELSYSQLKQGFRMLQSGHTIGKVVFTPDQDDLVPVIPKQTPYAFQPDASYVLAGGLGGLGRSLAQWMVSRGARNLIFLSRSGNITPPVQEMVSTLESKGVKIRIFKCDVSDAVTMRSAFEECSQTLPPIKGCIQCSMTLKDGAFETMPYADWTTTIKPKVQGSRNLHESLPADLEFFVMLSSVSGIMGSRSQANYTAGNNYQDALAKSRASKGQRAASLVLGPIQSVGFVAENLDYARHATRTMVDMREDELHAIMEYLIDPRHALTESTCQVIFGLARRQWFQERGYPLPEPLSHPLFTQFQNAGNSQQQVSQKKDTYHVQALLKAARTREEANEIVLNGIVEKLSSLLSVSSEEVDLSKSIRTNGIDSLIAMEFRAWLAKEVGTEMPLLDLMVGDSITELAQKVTSMSRFFQDNTAAPAE
ncbi:Type I Iterative PKS [Emmonsiellopsis sp. PD_5]|nr:Type I Iterative PKS [Emmonsiellopsis sp. PD_5]